MSPLILCFYCSLNIISYLEFISLFICHPSIVSQQLKLHRFVLTVRCYSKNKRVEIYTFTANTPSVTKSPTPAPLLFLKGAVVYSMGVREIFSQSFIFSILRLVMNCLTVVPVCILKSQHRCSSDRCSASAILLTLTPKLRL